jgi:vesicle coat complex subunit
LHDALNSKSFDEKKVALKKVIAQMTLGKDLSALFQSVLKLLEYPELDIKKLVYLYIINYSRTKPDEAIMTISSFRKDAANKTNPIIRALAVRTMSSLRVPKLNEYLVEPLKQALADEDPYVRKTAVLSIPKVFEIAPNDAETNNLVSLLEVLVTKESNGLVLANAIASLEEIAILSGRVHIRVDQQLLSRILVAINECMEWAQVYILDFLSKYSPKDEKEAEMYHSCYSGSSTA